MGDTALVKVSAFAQESVSVSTCLITICILTINNNRLKRNCININYTCVYTRVCVLAHVFDLHYSRIRHLGMHTLAKTCV